MKVIAVFKWSRDPVDARVGVDGGIDWRGVKFAANDDDPAVMEVARALAQGDGIVGLTMGDGDAAWAAARGAARTVVIEDATTELNSMATGAALAAAVKHCGDADVVIIGDSSWDYGVVSALIGKLGWTAVAGVVAAEPVDNGLKVTRKNEGVSEVLWVGLPAVLGAVSTREEKSAPGMKDVLAARKKPMERLTLADLAPDSTAAVESRGTRFPSTPSAHMIDGADPVAASEELMAGLHADGVL
ncbi:MAG: hypothetical protein FWD80_02230 [Propionibacteriaceae bacterium]|nr:hypothetical protein [Propionibacteriaceae bacterium]